MEIYCESRRAVGILKREDLFRKIGGYIYSSKEVKPNVIKIDGDVSPSLVNVLHSGRKEE